MKSLEGLKDYLKSPEAKVDDLGELAESVQKEVLSKAFYGFEDFDAEKLDATTISRLMEGLKIIKRSMVLGNDFIMQLVLKRPLDMDGENVKLDISFTELQDFLFSLLDIEIDQSVEEFGVVSESTERLQGVEEGIAISKLARDMTQMI